MNHTLRRTITIFALSSLFCAQATSQSEDESHKSDTQQLTEKLDELQEEKLRIQSEIDRIQALLSEQSGFPEEATIAAGTSELTGLNSWIDLGDIRVRLLSYSQDRRSFNVKKRFDVLSDKPIAVEIPVYGVIVEVENLSPGRGATPFEEGSMFLSKSEVLVIDNWGNRLNEESLQSSEYDTAPGPKADFVFEGEKVLPGESKKFFKAVATPDVTSNISWYVIRLTVDTGSDKALPWFFVPASEVKNLGVDLKQCLSCHL